MGEMIYWQQSLEQQSFRSACRLDPNVEEKGKDGNWFWFIPPWYENVGKEVAALANGERRPYAPLLGHDQNKTKESTAPLPDLPDRQATPQWEGPSGWNPDPSEVPDGPDELFRKCKYS